MVLSPVSLPNASLTLPRRPWPWFFALSVPLMATSPSHRENRPAGRVGDIGVYLVGQSPNVKVVPLGSSDYRGRGRHGRSSGALDRTLPRKPRTTETAVTTDITIVAISSGSQTGREWSTCQITTTNNRVVTNTTMSRQCSMKYLVFLLNS